MEPESTPTNGKREMGQIVERIANLHNDVREIKANLSKIALQCPARKVEIETLQRDVSALWGWKDCLTPRGIALAMACVTLAGVVASVVVHLSG